MKIRFTERGDADEAIRDAAENPVSLDSWNSSAALAELGSGQEDAPPMDMILWNALLEHSGHKVSIVTYGDSDRLYNICLECEDCGEVILDAEIYTLCGREDGYSAVEARKQLTEKAS